MINPLAKNVLAAVTAVDTGVHNKIIGLEMATLTNSIGVMENFMKIVKSLEESGLSIKGLNETIENK